MWGVRFRVWDEGEFDGGESEDAKKDAELEAGSRREGMGRGSSLSGGERGVRH
jgi:hypothetical protein